MGLGESGEEKGAMSGGGLGAMGGGSLGARMRSAVVYILEIERGALPLSTNQRGAMSSKH